MRRRTVDLPDALNRRLQQAANRYGAGLTGTLDQRGLRAGQSHSGSPSRIVPAGRDI